jgi:hypothetical protein
VGACLSQRTFFPFELVAEQDHLKGYIPTVVGPVEFREWKKQLERIDGILGLGEVEEMFQRLSLATPQDFDTWQPQRFRKSSAINVFTLCHDVHSGTIIQRA